MFDSLSRTQEDWQGAGSSIHCALKDRWKKVPGGQGINVEKSVLLHCATIGASVRHGSTHVAQTRDDTRAFLSSQRHQLVKTTAIETHSRPFEGIPHDAGDSGKAWSRLVSNLGCIDIFCAHQLTAAVSKD